MNSSGQNRRDVIKRAAAVGLIGIPGASLLSACATGGDSSNGGSGKAKGPEGKKSAKNPLAVDTKTPVETVIFDGGFGTAYAKYALDIYNKNFPNAHAKQSSTQDIAPKLQPRFAGGNPPDLIDNSGAKAMDTAGLASKGLLQNLNELLDAPSYDDPSKKVRDTLRPGVVELGQYGSDATYAMNYAYTVYGVWYSQSLMDKHGWKYPETWDEMIKLCKEIKKTGIAPWTYAGRYPYYVHFTLFPLMAKIGGPDVLKKIDNLEPNAFKQPAVKQAVEMYAELAAKGYIMQGSKGLTHIQSQTAWTKYKAVFIPNGSWVENEAKPTTPKDFKMSVNGPSGAGSSDKMPFPSTRAVAGEPYLVPAKGKNPRGGMELLRIMLGKEASNNFAKSVSSLSSLNTEPTFAMPPGLSSANSLLKAAGSNIITWRLPDWYQKLEKDQIGQQLTGDLMAGRIKPDEWVKKAQQFADQTAKDSSIKKYKR